MDLEHLRIAKYGDVAVLALDRPPANAFDPRQVSAFEVALAHPTIASSRALVLTATGEFFSAGLDLKTVPRLPKAEQEEFLGGVNRSVAKLYSFPVPVIGAINGHAIGGGFILALSTDYRIGPDTSAKFGMTEARVGVPFPAVPMIVVSSELPPHSVRYCAMYARKFDAEVAQRHGVFDELRSPSEMLDRALEVAEDMASMPADSYRKVKHQVRGAAFRKIEKVLSANSDPMLQSWLSAKAPEASAAMLNGSVPAE
jgi:enoyl-CoA hydratase